MNKSNVTFFNMSKVLKLSGNKTYNIKRAMSNKSLIKGTSYLLNLDSLMQDDSDSFYISSYIYLASFRNYADYILLGIKYLDLSLIPDINIDIYKGNPLLTIEKNKINFKYE